MRRHATSSQAPWVLVGAKPVDGVIAAGEFERPVIVIADPVDGPSPDAARNMTVLEVPFKSNPLAILETSLPHPLSGVASFTELGLLPAAALAESLGLPGVPVAAVLRTRDKLLMRRSLCGRLPQPAFGVCGHEAPGAYPVIIKPRMGSGSRGVQYVSDAQTFRAVAARHAGWLWERFIEGAEYSVEAVTIGGRHHILGITEKRTTGRPHFVETGHVVPAPVRPAVANTLRAMTMRCLDGLGVTVGPSHTELKVAGGDAFIIETHTRTGGDRIPLLTKLVTGQDQRMLALRSLSGSGLRELPPPAAAVSAVAGVRYFPWQDCSVAAVSGIDACRRRRGVVEAELAVRPGDTIPVWRYSHERPGFVVAAADDHQALERRLDAAMAEVRLTSAAPSMRMGRAHSDRSGGEARA